MIGLVIFTAVEMAIAVLAVRLIWRIYRSEIRLYLRAIAGGWPGLVLMILVAAVALTMGVSK